MLSVRQKQCSKFSNEKSLVFLTVNLVEILHASTYGIYKNIYKVKKIAAATARHQPPRRGSAEIGTRAHVHHFVLEKEERKL